MTLADLSIKRPIFITCIVVVMLVLGFLSMQRLGVDLFPNVTFPVVLVTTAYPGAGPSEMETLVSRVLEDEISTVAGIKWLRSLSREGMSIVVAEFVLETDTKYAEQQVRDRVSSAKVKLPKDIKEPVIRRIDPSDQPIIIVSITGNLPEAKLYDVADEVVRPKIEQVDHVGLVEVIGGRKREIRVELEQAKLKAYEVSATMVAQRLASTGLNIPAGKVNRADKEAILRTLGEFQSFKDIESTLVNFVGNDVPVTLRNVGTVTDGLEDEKARTFHNGVRSIFLMVFRQSGANTIAVADAIRARVSGLNKELEKFEGKPSLSVIRDSAKMIRSNVDDVKESILIGVALTILVVFFFLGNVRSTFITGMALPNSLLGAFVLMALASFTVNVMTLLALSLAVGLLIDDAIVVRENIFRHMERGSPPAVAAREGTLEVTLAVIATTSTVIAVFGPIAFLQGIVGQFFKEFGLTICFAMAISLFDALTIAPMLSAYLAGNIHKKKGGIWNATVGRLLDGFSHFQDWLEQLYERVLHFSLAKPLWIIGGAVGLFVVSITCAKFVPKTFLPTQDFGEFIVGIELPSGANLQATAEAAQKVDEVIRSNAEVTSSVLMVGSREGESNVASFFVELVPQKKRRMNTTEFKDRLREQLKPFGFANPVVKDIDMVAGGIRPFTMNIVATDFDALEPIARKAYERLKSHPALKDVDWSHKPGKPEFQIVLDKRRAESLGISSSQLGAELRTLVDGSVPAVFREKGRQYDIRVRLTESERDLKAGFEKTFVPNINTNLIRLASVAQGVEAVGPASINRQERGRFIQISADMADKGPGMGALMDDIAKMFKTETALPPGVFYRYVGQAENFKELGTNMAIAALLAILFIYLVLASLYESFMIPFTIMLVLPLAVCGALIALFVSSKSLDMFSWIGCIMLLGIATKNSILLVDFTQQLIERGMDRNSAIIQAGKSRLRPILMTTVALIAGMLPIAIGLNEAARQRTSMGISVVGGLISSTLLSLVVVPASYSYIDRFRIWLQTKLSSTFKAGVTDVT
ncbi:MAG: efflux RND transporter permease subunit [Deltaproteobacteria bacterium]|nr:efflux RND transporter permease subunit [Deltaproteobacteria bacterium]